MLIVIACLVGVVAIVGIGCLSALTRMTTLLDELLSLLRGDVDGS